MHPFTHFLVLHDSQVSITICIRNTIHKNGWNIPCNGLSGLGIVLIPDYAKMTIFHAGGKLVIVEQREKSYGTMGNGILCYKGGE